MREIDWSDDRMRTRLRQPVTIPRWLLTAKYAAFFLVGLAVLNTQPPTFERIYDTSLTAAWSILLSAAALFALVGTLRAAWERTIEKWGATLIFILMAIYAFAPIILVIQGDSDRTVYSAIAVLVSLLPYARAVQLWSKDA